MGPRGAVKTKRGSTMLCEVFLSEVRSDELESLLTPKLVLAGKDLQAEARLRTEGAIDLDQMRVGCACPGNRKDRVFLAVFDEEGARRHEAGDVGRLGNPEDARDVVVDAVVDRVDAVAEGAEGAAQPGQLDPGLERGGVERQGAAAGNPHAA